MQLFISLLKAYNCHAKQMTEWQDMGQHTDIAPENEMWPDWLSGTTTTTRVSVVQQTGDLGWGLHR